MLRWIAWFVFGCALFASIVVLSRTRPHDLDLLAGLVVVAMWGWALVTLYAVPVGVIRWLLRGRRRAR